MRALRRYVYTPIDFEQMVWEMSGCPLDRQKEGWVPLEIVAPDEIPGLQVTYKFAPLRRCVPDVVSEDLQRAWQLIPVIKINWVELLGPKGEVIRFRSDGDKWVIAFVDGFTVLPEFVIENLLIA